MAGLKWPPEIIDVAAIVMNKVAATARADPPVIPTAIVRRAVPPNSEVNLRRSVANCDIILYYLFLVPFIFHYPFLLRIRKFRTKNGNFVGMGI
jgi:hypothetical protein